MTLELIRSGRDKLVETIATGYRKEPGTVKDMEISTHKLLTELFRFAESERHLMVLLLIKGQGARSCHPGSRLANLAGFWTSFPDQHRESIRAWHANRVTGSSGASNPASLFPDGRYGLEMVVWTGGMTSITSRSIRRNKWPMRLRVVNFTV